MKVKRNCLVVNSVKESHSIFSRGKYARMAVFTGAFLLVVSSFVAPIRQSLMGFPNGETLYRALSLICHQFPAKSFWILGFPCGLCSRCLLGYAGVAFAALFVTRPHRYSKRLLLGIILLIPGLADVMVQIATGYEGINFTRAITGFTGGIGLFIIAYPLKMRSSLTKKENYL